MPEKVVTEKIIPDNIISEKEAVSDLTAMNMDVSDEAWKADMEMNTVSVTDRKEEVKVLLYGNKPYSEIDKDEVKSERQWYQWSGTSHL